MDAKLQQARERLEAVDWSQVSRSRFAEESRWLREEARRYETRTVGLMRDPEWDLTREEELDLARHFRAVAELRDEFADRVSK